MPTNKLWIEHTERAAWQSVQALREKLADAERRAERMAPPAQGWRELFDALDAARERHALAGRTYAELVQDALERIARAESDRRSLESRHAGVPTAPMIVEPSRPSRSRVRPVEDWDDEDDAPPSERPNRSERRLFEEIQRRARELALKRPRPDLHGVLSGIETRLLDLPGLERSELFEIAVDLGALALCLGTHRQK